MLNHISHQGEIQTEQDHKDNLDGVRMPELRISPSNKNLERKLHNKYGEKKIIQALEVTHHF